MGTRSSSTARTCCCSDADYVKVTTETTGDVGFAAMREAHPPQPVITEPSADAIREGTSRPEITIEDSGGDDDDDGQHVYTSHQTGPFESHLSSGGERDSSISRSSSISRRRPRLRYSNTMQADLSSPLSQHEHLGLARDEKLADYMTLKRRRPKSRASVTSNMQLQAQFSASFNEGYLSQVDAMANFDFDTLECDTFFDVCELTPVQVLQNSFSHLKFDPDGGILNLDPSSGQFSKMPLLVPGPIKFVVAAITSFFAFFNPYAVVKHSMWVYEKNARMKLERCDGPICGWLHISWNVFTFSNLSIFFSVLECALVVYFIADAMRWLVIAVHAHVSGRPEKARNVKFFCLCKFTFKPYRRLQNVSVLLGLTFWHPCLLGKHYKRYFQGRRAAVARFLAEALLGKEENTTTDDELRFLLLSLAAKVENAGQDLSDVKKTIEQRMHWPLVTLVNLMPSEADLLKFDKLPKDINPKVMSRKIRLKLIGFVEDILFLMVLSIVIIVTGMGFFVKIYTVYTILNESDGRITWCVMEKVFVMLNQVMGSLSINILLTERIQVFVMGGTDATLTKEEYDIFSIYFAMVMDRIWSSTELNVAQKVVISLTFEDDEIQHLCMEEDHGQKSAVARGARLFMDNHMKAPYCDETKMLRWFALGK